MKILIADDEEWIRYDLRETLFELIPDSTIKEARNGREFIQRYKEFNPDLSFVDIRMPGKSGLEALEEINPSNSQTLFVILTGFADFEYARKAIHLGIAEYMLKPVSLDELNQFLEKNFTDKLHPESGDDKKEKSQILIGQAEELIRQRYMAPIGVGEIADALNISANYLSSQFKRWTGTSFTSYITGLRMDKACELLTIPGARVNQISEKLGYSSSRHFARLFQQHTGKTPTDYICSHA